MNGYGVEGAIALWNTFDAQTIDGLIFVSNQLRTAPEERLEAYLKQCADEHYQQQPEQRLKDLGVTEDMIVIRDQTPELANEVLARIEAKNGQKKTPAN